MASPRAKRKPAARAADPESDSSSKRTSTATWIFVVAFIVVIGGLIWYLRFTPEPDYNYRNFPITKGTCTATEVQCYYLTMRIRTSEYTISFYNHPKDLEDINVTAQSVATMYVLQSRRNPEIIMGLPESAPGSIAIAATELARVLGTRTDAFNFPVHPAIIGDTPDKVSCGNVTTSKVVVLFQQEELTRVYARAPNCIIVAGKDVRDVVRAADAYSYHLLQVMDTPDLRIGGNVTNSTNSSEVNGSNLTLPMPPVLNDSNMSAP